MATDRQIMANRLNALKSTGPRTPEGKARAALNHLKTGIDAKSAIIPGENPEDLQALADRYFADLQPATEDERFYVDTLVQCEWRSRRFAHAEAEIWADGMEGPLRRHETNPAGTGFNNRSNTLDRLDRCIERNQRVYSRTRRELDLLQSARLAAEAADPEPAQTAAEPAAPTPEVRSEDSNPIPAPAAIPPIPAKSESASSSGKPRGYNPRNPNHPPIELCPVCNHYGQIHDRCPFRAPAVPGAENQR